MNTQNFSSTTSSQKPKKILNSRQSAAFNISQLKKLNQDLLLKMERQKVQQELESVKKDTKSVLDDIPMMTFDDDPHAKGWKSIYLGLYSPFSNKYTAFMKHAIEKAKENSNSPHKNDKSRNSRAFGNIEGMPNFVQQLVNLSQKRGLKRNGSLYGNGSVNGDLTCNKSDNPPSRTVLESQEMSQNQWQEQQEMQYILMFEGLSKHKRNIIEEQIRNGNQNNMAQKYLHLVQQKKLKRTLQEVFQVKQSSITNKNNMLKKDLFNNNAFYSLSQSRRKSSQRLDTLNLLTPTIEQEGASDLQSQKNQLNNCEPKHSRALSLSDFKFIDMRWQLNTSNIPQIQDITKRFRSRSAQGRIDSKVINKTLKLSHGKFGKQSFFGLRNLQTQDVNNQQHKKEIIRRKSCECATCGGETKKIPIAALYEEDDIESDLEEGEQKETYSTGITLKFPVTQNHKPRAASIFKNLIGIITKGSPSNRQQLKNSKTQANLIFDGFASANTLKPNNGSDKNLDFFDKEKIVRKYKGTKQFGGLSPIYDIERVVKKKMGLNKSKIKNQQTQKSPNQIDLFSPSKPYKKLVTVDSMSNYIQSPKSSSATESPESTRKASQIKLSQDKFEGFLNLKTMQLPNHKDRDNFFSLRQSGKNQIQEFDSKDVITEENQQSNKQSQFPADLTKSRNNQTNSQLHISLLQNKNLNQIQSTTHHSNLNHNNKNSLVQSLLYRTQNKFLDRVSSFQFEMKYNMQKKEEDQQKHKKQEQQTLLNSQSLIQLPQIQQQHKNRYHKKSNSQSRKNEKLLKSYQKGEQKLSNNQKDIRDHLAYEKVYYQRLSKQIK